MPYYLREAPMMPPELWFVDERRAVRQDVTNPMTFEATESESVWDILGARTGWFTKDAVPPFTELRLDPGHCYPGIARPWARMGGGEPWNPRLDCERDDWARARGQLAALTSQLFAICRVVQPSSSTMSVYGHEIRNLLLLAATEVESHWRRVLTLNGASLKGSSTAMFFPTRDVLALPEYEVSFHQYPWMEPVAPFRTWVATEPTKSLPWFDDYNAVKHNRDDEFHRATLQSAFEALAACAILTVARFGRKNAFAGSPELGTFFRFEALPYWPLGEQYCGLIGLKPDQWVTIQHPDLAAVQWK